MLLSAWRVEVSAIELEWSVWLRCRIWCDGHTTVSFLSHIKWREMMSRDLVISTNVVGVFRLVMRQRYDYVACRLSGRLQCRTRTMSQWWRRQLGLQRLRREFMMVAVTMSRVCLSNCRLSLGNECCCTLTCMRMTVLPLCLTNCMQLSA